MTASSSAQASPAPNRHVSALDGVRGLAFCMVFFQHFAGGNHIHVRALEAIRGAGWTGVDLFFCLSGFLITGILFDTQTDAKYFPNFYARRALRIFPLYYLCLAAIVLLTPLLHWPWHTYHLCYPFYCSNFLNALSPAGDTFGFQPWLDLGHFWSLAVEEQFYLAWPLVVLLCGTRKNIIAACAALLLGSVVLRALFISFYLHPGTLALAPGGPWLAHLFLQMPRAFFFRTFLYRITFFRFDALAAGGILAMLMRGQYSSVALRWLRVVTPFLFLGCAIMLGRSWHFETPGTATFGYTLLALFFAGVIAMSISWRPASRAFQVRPLRTIGKYSYGMYVFHQLARPAIPIVIRHLQPLFGSVVIAATVCAAGWFVITFLLAFVSFHLFESRFLAFKRHFAYSRRDDKTSQRSARGAPPADVLATAHLQHG